MRCKDVRDRLTEYQLDLLNADDRERIEVHLDECADCRAELAALERLDALVEPAEQLEAPANLWSGVRQRMEPRRAPWWRVWRGPVRQAVAVGAALLLAVVGVWLGLRGGPVETGQYEVLGADYQEQQIVAQWSQPLADDAALGAMYVSVDGNGERR